MSEEENEQPLVERLRWSDGWFFENPWDHVTYVSDDPFEAADEIERLREALKEVFEAWAGSEGFIPETAPEGYLLYLTKRMAHIAREALGETK
jgi:hypothetical protein